MKSFAFWLSCYFLLISSWGMANSTSEKNVEQEWKAEGVLTFTHPPVVTVNEENRKKFFQSNAQDNIQRFQQKRFPLLFAVFSTGATVLAALLPIGIKKIKDVLQKPREMLEEPKTKASKALEELSKQDLFTEGLSQHFYVEVANIVRFYLEEHFRFKAVEKTTEQIMEQVLTMHPFPTYKQQQLQELLSRADLVKFANSHPTTEECLWAHQTATKLIAD